MYGGDLYHLIHTHSEGRSPTRGVILYGSTFQEFDVSKVTVNELEFEGKFQLEIEHDTHCHVSHCHLLVSDGNSRCLWQAIVGYFEAGFMGPQHTEFLRTGPQSPPTHWKQTVLYLQDPLPVHTGIIGSS